LDVIKYCVEVVNKRIPVIAGTGSNCTETAIYLSTEAEKAGADGLLVVSPYYNKATQNGLYTHFKTVADAVNVPIILYNIPGRTGVNINPATIMRLCNDCENIVGVKEASGNISQVAKLAALTEGKLDIYSGNDDQIIPVCSLGGIGVISVLANVAPKETHDMVMYWLSGKWKEALDLQLKALPLVEQLFIEVNPIPVKAALNMQGFNVGSPRLPLTELTDAHKETLRKAMIDFGCL
jgi:4-hydroxy-tetrahydrodipicolinate synthase